MTGSEPIDPDPDEGLPADLGFEAARAAQAAHWATTTPAQRLAWLTEAQQLAHLSGALPRPRPQSDLDGWNEVAESPPQDPDEAAADPPKRQRPATSGGGCRGGTP